jgi:hypothetical protein
MAGDVCTKVNAARIGSEGGAYICPNGLQIVAYPSGLRPTFSKTINPDNLSGVYDTRFDDVDYYTT